MSGWLQTPYSRLLVSICGACSVVLMSLLVWNGLSDGASAAGKASKKNAKRQAARAKKRLLQDVEAPEAAATPAMVSVASTSAAPQPSSRARAPNRLEVLRSEMAAAKAAGVSVLLKAEALQDEVLVGDLFLLIFDDLLFYFLDDKQWRS